MAQLIKCPPHKREGWSLIPQNPGKEPGVTVPARNPSTGKMEALHFTGLTGELQGQGKYYLKK